MVFTFHNVLVTLEADTAQEAYNKLCLAFASHVPCEQIEYTTDTWSSEVNPGELRSTQELMGE